MVGGIKDFESSARLIVFSPLDVVFSPTHVCSLESDIVFSQLDIVFPLSEVLFSPLDVSSEVRTIDFGAVFPHLEIRRWKRKARLECRLSMYVLFVPYHIACQL